MVISHPYANKYLYLFVLEAVRSRRSSVREELRQPRLTLVLHAAAVGHSEQVHAVAVQRATQQLAPVVNLIGRADAHKGTLGPFVLSERYSVRM